MNPTLKCLLIATIILSMISISLATEELSKGYLAIKFFPLLPKGKELAGLLKRTKRYINNRGRSRSFCELFHCEEECNVPEENRCCEGFSYDRRSKKCREVFTSY
ncbi:hypothetical protein TNIN_271101 [Trichonephila inaurata madagascariensis]|uniref:Uncharacterized protein n=1 Tax=Trichonephila inaurata madagascariensis TaxID=2747483 RepID=A0A8X6WL77_9ARAC|nr:hypothetical protein TNIN_271101 [Trichonephila inaurata madagascariensis]